MSGLLRALIPKHRVRKRVSAGPFFVNTAATNGRPRVTSHGFKIGKLHVNLTRRTVSWDHDGPGAWHWDLPGRGGRR